MLYTCTRTRNPPCFLDHVPVPVPPVGQDSLADLLPYPRVPVPVPPGTPERLRKQMLPGPQTRPICPCPIPLADVALIPVADNIEQFIIASVIIFFPVKVYFH